jgi:demethylmenaquinone methyltransferase / 2-methoxy-6-polyprenyl-1,4-benzoquinol methylase
LMIADKLRTISGTAVTGLDFSPNMLEIAARRSAKAMTDKHSCRLEWVQGDAQNLPAGDNTFDGAVISFGLRNLTDLQRGINEMARVVKPGGKVINLDLGHSHVPVFASLFRFYFRHVVPVIGDLLQHDRQAYTYLPESLNTYPKPAKISEMFEAAGLTGVVHIPIALGSVAMHVGIKTGAT